MRKRAVAARLVPALTGLCMTITGCAGNDGGDPVAPLSTSEALGSPCADVLMQGVDRGRTNAQTCEASLTPANLTPPGAAATGFGKLYSRYVRGRINAQPLVVNSATTAAGTYDLAVVATMQNEVYAFDAGNTSTDPYAGVRWHTTLAPPANVEDMLAEATGQYYQGPAYPHIGVMGTPVIDRNAGPYGTIYLLSFSESGASAPHGFDFSVVSLDLGDGHVIASKQVPRTFTDGLYFNPINHNQRAGLLLQNGTIYAAFASAAADGNNGYTGWIMGFKASDLSLAGRISVGQSGGGIWQSGAGLAGDLSTGDVFAMTGNDPKNGACPRCDAFLRLPGGSLNPASATATQQANEGWLNVTDADLASSGPMVLPDHRIAGGGKSGLLHVFAAGTSIGLTDPAPPAGFPSVGASTPTATTAGAGASKVDVFRAATCDPTLFGLAPAGQTPCNEDVGSPVMGILPHIHGRAFWNGSFYIWGERSRMRRFDGATYKLLAENTAELEVFDPSYFGNGTGSYGWMVPPLYAVSGNGGSSGSGGTNGIVWSLRGRGPHVGAQTVQSRGLDGEPYAAPGTLLAFDASTMKTIWSSDTDGPHDGLPSMSRLSTPTIASGRVYVPTWSDELVVYGLNAPARPASGLPAGAVVSAATDSTGSWAFAVDNQGKLVYRTTGAPANAPSTGFMTDLTGASNPVPLTVPGASVTAVGAGGHISVFFVDLLGRIVQVYRDNAGPWHADNMGVGFTSGKVYGMIGALSSENVGLGGRGTAPPGAPVAAVAAGTAGLERLEVGVVGHVGQPLHFFWSNGWASVKNTAHDWTSNAAPLSTSPAAAFALQRTPLGLVCRNYKVDCELYWSTNSVSPTGSRNSLSNSTIFNTWRGSGAWSPGPFNAMLVADRTPISVVSRTSTNEDVFWVKNGLVNRMMWTGGAWSAAMSFSSSGMLPERTLVAAQDMSATQVNLLAVDGAGQIKSEWSTGATAATAQWNVPSGTAWTSPVSTPWQTYAGAGTASSAVSIVPNWPSAGDLDLYYVGPTGQLVYQHHGGYWWAPAAVAMP